MILQNIQNYNRSRIILTFGLMMGIIGISVATFNFIYIAFGLGRNQDALKASEILMLHGVFFSAVGTMGMFDHCWQQQENDPMRNATELAEISINQV